MNLQYLKWKVVFPRMSYQVTQWIQEMMAEVNSSFIQFRITKEL